ncbi:hypothetical protein DVH24_026577 [Malus domestica]|uniref:Metallothionein-like protein n=1 Tax=Malus domestica TaxID=3750 RepID=A0A498KPY1_MALDO|nr:hypothetical protein DVH24_026577 [Malus domestica]
MSSSCSCGSDCKCGSGCKCGMHIDLGTQRPLPLIPSLLGSFEGSEMNYGAENDCKCGSNCSCSSCGCNK